MRSVVCGFVCICCKGASFQDSARCRGTSGRQTTGLRNIHYSCHMDSDGITTDVPSPSYFESDPILHIVTLIAPRGTSALVRRRLLSRPPSSQRLALSCIHCLKSSIPKSSSSPMFHLKAEEIESGSFCTKARSSLLHMYLLNISTYYIHPRWIFPYILERSTLL